MMKILLASALIALGLAGCGSMTKILPKQEIPPPPANLVVRCPGIPLIQNDANMGDLVKYTTELMEQYNECAMKHDDLTRATEGRNLTTK
jgi:hypothetical protein